MEKRTGDIALLLNNRILRHLLFWLGYIFTMTYIHSLGVRDGFYFRWFMNYLIELPVLLGLTYLVTYYIIPVYLRKGKYFLASLLLLSSFFSFSFLNVILEEYLINPFFFPDREKGEMADIGRVLTNGFGLIFPVGIFVSVSFARFSAEKSRRESLTERKKLKSEQDMILGRMHPVFLRDALDDIYTMSRENSPALPEMVLKISDILHYFLYECEADQLPLRKEEQAIRTFLGFYKLRFGDQFGFDIFVQGDLENTHISAFILFPLVRSVCRFNSDYEKNPGKVYIQFEINENFLNFTVSQKIENVGMVENIEFDWKEEIKLARKRLEFKYAWKYDLDIIETERKLKVKLSLNLN